MGYVEKDCPKIKVRGLRPYDTYELSWFNPRSGEWLDNRVTMEVTHAGNITLLQYPDELDWAFKLRKLNTDFPIKTDDMVFEPRRGNLKFTYIEKDSKN